MKLNCGIELKLKYNIVCWIIYRIKPRISYYIDCSGDWAHVSGSTGARGLTPHSLYDHEFYSLEVHTTLMSISMIVLFLYVLNILSLFNIKLKSFVNYATLDSPRLFQTSIRIPSGLHALPIFICSRYSFTSLCLFAYTN